MPSKSTPPVALRWRFSYHALLSYEEVALVRMDIQTVVMGSLQMSSLVVLKKHDENGPQIHLPIRIGPIEAAAITASIEDRKSLRPLTHDLLSSVIDSLGARLASICIVDVRGTTFYATLQLVRSDGSRTDVDCRPSDAIALALRCGAPIFAREHVLSTATMPDFQTVEQDNEEREFQAFHDFVENLSPEDFA